MDLLEEAESLILYQFSQSLKFNGLIRGLVTPFQEALDHVEKLHHGRYIEEGHGYTLDVIGDIVDFKRQDMRDEDYRVWLKVVILLNHSHGTANGVLAILQVLFGDRPDIQMDEYSPNVVMFTFFKYPTVPTKILFSIMRRALPLTTKCQFVDASSGASSLENRINATGFNSDRDQTLPTFQLDVSGFDDSVFADFFEEINDNQ
jgi:hypothetical protein